MEGLDCVLDWEYIRVGGVVEVLDDRVEPFYEG